MAMCWENQLQKLNLAVQSLQAGEEGIICFG